MGLACFGCCLCLGYGASPLFVALGIADGGLAVGSLPATAAHALPAATPHACPGSVNARLVPLSALFVAVAVLFSAGRGPSSQLWS
jgi:hypothetical protein